MKKKLLIGWLSPYIFDEVILPFIPQLAEHFRIVVIIGGFSGGASLQTKRYLKQLVIDGTIEECFFTPPQERLFSVFLFLRSILSILRRHRFDILLSAGVADIFERYIVDCVVPKHCLRICLQHSITFLFTNESVARALLMGTKKEVALIQKKSRHRDLMAYVHQVKSKLLRERSLIKFFVRVIFNRIKYLFIYTRKKFQYYIDRYVLPSLFFGKMFPPGQYDALTEFGSPGALDAVIFCDSMEARVHKILFPKAKICVAQYPAKRVCRCDIDAGGSRTILSPLSGFVGQKDILEDDKALYYRDLQTVFRETGVDSVHLRLHPRETGQWPYRLQEYLLARGMNAIVTESRQPLHEIVCRYRGVAGFSSCALRDARAFCDYGFVVGFIAVSRRRYSDPSFVYGNAEGIGWIMEDGTYNSDIFIRRKHVPSVAKDIVRIVTELAYTDTV